MSLIIFLVVGLIAGALASYILGRQQDLLINLLVGRRNLGRRAAAVPTPAPIGGRA